MTADRLTGWLAVAAAAVVLVAGVGSLAVTDPARGADADVPQVIAQELAEEHRPAGPPPPRTHVVETGDTLWKIAVAHDVTVEELMSRNGLTEPDRLVLGQEILVPASAAPRSADADDDIDDPVGSDDSDDSDDSEDGDDSAGSDHSGAEASG